MEWGWVRTYEDKGGFGKGLGVGLRLEAGLGEESRNGLNLPGFGDRHS